MARKFNKVPQPPIDPDSRPTEHRPIWQGLLIVVIVGVVLTLGVLKTHQTSLGTTHEWTLVKKATVGGLMAAVSVTPQIAPAVRATSAPTTQASQPAATSKPAKGDEEFCPT